MLFILHDNLEGTLRDAVINSAERHAFDYLAGAVWEGKHCFTGSPKLLRALKTLPSLSIKSLRVIENAINSISDDVHLTSSLPVLGMVTTDVLPRPTSFLHGSQRKIEFPLRWFDDSAKLQATWILCENLNDAKLIKFITETVRGILAARGKLVPRINSRLHPGGGTTTADLVDHLHQMEELSICFVDSDKKHPWGRLGQTASKVLQFDDCGNFPTTGVWVTPEHELENYLPNIFFERIYGFDPNHMRSISTLKGLTADGEHQLRCFLDIKKGLSLKHYFDLNATGRYYWAQKLPKLATLAGVNLSAFACYQVGNCAQPTNCNCRITNGYTEDLLVRFLDAFKTLSPKEIDKKLDDSVRKVWLTIAEIVTAWCCAKDRMRS